MARIVILPGDGIGPEVAREAVACLKLVSDRRQLGLEFEEQVFGGAAIDATGDPFPAVTQAACEASDAILLGAVGGPKWDDSPQRPEAGLLKMRGTLGLFANLRPARTLRGLEHLSPLRADIVRGADVLVVRELTGGLYFGEKVEGTDQASDMCSYSRIEVERIARVAFEAARKRRGKVTSVDKANVLATSRLWRRVVNEVATQFPDVELDHALVDSTAMALITSPTRFDVILTENLFGDILSDELSVIGGSIGLLASASTGASGTAVFEPIHGSAPDIAGQDIANPAGAIASAAMLLQHLGHDAEAKLVEAAVEQIIAEGLRTRDLGGTASCSAFGERVRQVVDELLSAPLEKVA
ncbi:MAG: 3-isopropylmalate dehydrogenase [Sphingomicrobium sp.]